MVDTCVSGAYGAIRGGSSPPSGTIKKIGTLFPNLFYIDKTGQATYRFSGQL